MGTRKHFEMQFDLGTIKHLGLQMYSTFPPVMGELVSNAWDADASEVRITIPEEAMSDSSEIVIEDNGSGMTEEEVQNAYLVIGRDRRKECGDAVTTKKRKVMGRKGIGKFSAFGVASEMEIETVKNGSTTRFLLRYQDFERDKDSRNLMIPSLAPTGTLSCGTRISLRRFTKYRTRKVDITNLRRGVARRFSIIGGTEEDPFDVYINNSKISVEERDLTRLLEKDADGNLYIWRYNNASTGEDRSWTVSGWIGALKRSSPVDGIQRGIAVMARGKLVQEPFVFDATVGQQFALSYLVGELHADFVDEVVDTIGTSRNSLVWDTEMNSCFKEWGQREVNRVAREWAEKRKTDTEKQLQDNPVYKSFVEATKDFADRGTRRVADKLIRKVISDDPLADASKCESLVQLTIDFMAFDAFKDMATEIEVAEIDNIPKVVELFRNWEVLEAKEMMRVTSGRIETIRKLHHFIATNALEVPTLHTFLKSFPWVLDPRWTLIADEKRYSDLLRSQFREGDDIPEEDRRIDFLCVSEGDSIIVVEIKRPLVKASVKELDQIQEYVIFMKDHVKRTTDISLQHKNVVGYLLVGDTVNTPHVRERLPMMQNNGIYVRRYSDLLSMVEHSHKEFLDRYDQLKRASVPVVGS